MIKQLAVLLGVMTLATVLAQAGEIDTRFDGDYPLKGKGRATQTITLTCRLERAPIKGEPKKPWKPLAGQEVTLTVKWGAPIGPITYPGGNAKALTDADGVATIAVPIPAGVKPGRHTCQAYYAGVPGLYQHAPLGGFIDVLK